MSESAELVVALIIDHGAKLFHLQRETEMKHLLLVLLLCAPARADFVGVFPGNDDLSNVASMMCGGYTPTLLGKVEVFPGADNGFQAWGTLALQPDEWLIGGWYYPGPEKVNLITIKAGNEWAAYCVLNPCEEIVVSKRLYLSSTNVSSSGSWDTGDLGWKGISHISAWSVDCHGAPIPGSLALVLCGLLPIAVIVCLANKVTP